MTTLIDNHIVADNHIADDNHIVADNHIVRGSALASQRHDDVADKRTEYP